MITAEQLEQWKALAEAATPGPWAIVENTVQAGDSLFVGTIFSDDTPANADFIAAARTVVPALLAEVDQLRAELDEQYYMLDKIDAYIDYAAETTPERWSFEEWVRLYREEEEKYA